MLSRYPQGEVKVQVRSSTSAPVVQADEIHQTADKLLERTAGLRLNPAAGKGNIEVPPSCAGRSQYSGKLQVMCIQMGWRGIKVGSM